MNVTISEYRRIQIHTHSEEETLALGQIISRHCKAGDCITLKGDLGAGKTVFCRGLIRAHTHDQTEVTSPTFTLLQLYEYANAPTLYHYDFYRLEEAAEIMETGLEEALDHGITLIEWPDIAQDHLPDHCFRIHIHYGESEHTRQIVIEADENRWAACMNEVVNDYTQAR